MSRRATPATAPATSRTPRASREGVMARIREAAIAEFSEHGFKGTSTQAIARRAGLTKPQLHYYIAGKEALYEELLASVVAPWRTMFNAASDDPARVLGDYVRAKLVQAFEQPEVSRLFTREVLDGGHNLDNFWPESRKRMREKVEAIRRWIDLGLISPMDPHVLLMSIWAMTQFYADSAVQVQQLMNPRRTGWQPDQAALVEELTGFVLRGCGIRR